MPNPKNFKDQNSFMSSWMHTRQQEGKGKNHAQNVAIGLSVWKNRNRKKKSDVHQELTAMAQLASAFEQRGDLQSGEIITEAMNEIAKIDKDKCTCGCDDKGCSSESPCPECKRSCPICKKRMIR